MAEVVAEPRRFSMSELVERVEVPAATIRYYLAAGLLPPPAKVAPNRFLYDERHAEIVRIVRLLRERRGLPLEVIRSLLPDLLPDLLPKAPESAEGGVFRPEMWQQVLAAHAARDAEPPVRERLVEAGLIAFGHRGYSDVSVDDVCRAVAIAKGTFYRHFDSKSELYFAVVDAVAGRVEAALRGARRDRPPGRAATVALLAGALEPYLTILLDVSSLANQRRPGHARALRSLLSALAEALVPLASEAADEVRAGMVERAVAQAMGRIGEDLAPIAAVGAGHGGEWE